MRLGRKTRRSSSGSVPRLPMTRASQSLPMVPRLKGGPDPLVPEGFADTVGIVAPVGGQPVDRGQGSTHRPRADVVTRLPAVMNRRIGRPARFVTACNLLFMTPARRRVVGLERGRVDPHGLLSGLRVGQPHQDLGEHTPLAPAVAEGLLRTVLPVRAGPRTSGGLSPPHRTIAAPCDCLTLLRTAHADHRRGACRGTSGVGRIMNRSSG